VIEKELDIRTDDGLMNTFVTHPEEGAPHPVVLFYMDAPGKREELHDMARRLGTAGYYVMLPNLYYRAVREFNLFSGDPSHTRERLGELMASVKVEMVDRDTAALLREAEGDPAADTGRIGCMGYCMSGPFAFAMAGLYPERIRAAASLYGVRLFGPGSPAELAGKVQGELYFACAEHDDYAPPEMIRALEEHLSHLDVRARVEWYPGTHHGFAFPTRGAVYDKASAERHWERLHALFRRNLDRAAPSGIG
jgi:carboxymethylenebutenolidase